MRKRLAGKLVLAYVLISFFTILAISVLFYSSFKKALLDRTFDQLSSINLLKKLQIESILQDEKVSKSLKSATFILNQRKTLETIRAYEKAFKPVQDVLFERTGMGHTGESYMVDEDFYMLSKSRFLTDVEPVSILVKTKATIRAKEGYNSKGIIKDYRGIDVLSVYRPLIFEGHTWAMITEIDYEEAMEPIRHVRLMIILISIAVLTLVALISLLISARITSPLGNLKKAILQLSKGRVNIEKPTPKSKDEIGEMTMAIDELIDSLQETKNFAIQIGRGNFDHEYNAKGTKDELGLALMRMKDELKEAKDKNRALEIESKTSLLAGQENERERFAADLHDGIGPLLTAIKLNVQKEKFDKKGTKELIDNTIEEIRRISQNLMPSVLLDFGAGAGIEALIEMIQPTTDVKIKFKNDINKKQAIKKDVHISIYRIAQECINNVLKHAEASTIRLSLTQFDDKLMFFCKDDGKGFNYSSYKYNKKSSNGLRNIEQRVDILGGKTFINTSNEGTEIEVEIPL